MECQRCGWIHDDKTPCLEGESEDWWLPALAQASARIVAEDGEVELDGLDHPDAASARKDPRVIDLARRLDPLPLIDAVLRAGPDARFPDGARVGDVFPELFSE